MKLNLFLSVLFIFAVLHLCKAGPLRLHKRAAFYIANETACVVDNIVYTNGDPIPTEDPCEACKCRPPGFACVLKECRVKPGCKAVRRVGQCCPEYICGCEHNGRMYHDGEEIKDPKNPCYECHCQGSSIACAFVDCFFRDGCDTVYLPGKCCPEYKNCTRDFPENKPFGGNALPPLNLLPALNDDSVLAVDYPSTTQTPEPSQKLTDPTQFPTPSSTDAETFAPESKESTELSNKPETTESNILVTEDIKYDPEVEERNSEKETTTNEEKIDLIADENDLKKEAVEVSEETKVLLHSEAEIKEEVNDDFTTVQNDPSESSVEEIKEEKPQTVSDEIVEAESQAEVTEKSAGEFTSTEIPESEKQVKNSAAENGKSLKISDEQLNDSEKEGIQVDEPEKTGEKSETVTEFQTESSSKTQSISEDSSSTDSKPEPEENKAEESQTNPQATPFYSNEKIKSESAETVTIVVHVREKANPTTEKDIVTEAVTPESVASVTQENLLKSNKLESTEISGESTKAEVISTDKNFEIFSSSTEISTDECTTKTPTTEEQSEGRSDETDSATSDVKNPTTEENVYDLKNDEHSSVTTTQTINDVTDISKEARASEEVEDKEADKPSVTIIKVAPSMPIKVKIITDPEVTPNTEEQTKNESDDKERTEETKLEEIVKENPTIKDESTAEIEEINPEVREEEIKEETLTEKTTPVENIEESKSTEKIEEPTSTEKIEESTRKTTEKAEERAEETESEETSEKTVVTVTEKSKPEETTELKDQVTEESKETEAPSDNE